MIDSVWKGREAESHPYRTQQTPTLKRNAMPSTTFSSPASPSITSALQAKSTRAKVCFLPKEIFVDARVVMMEQGDERRVEVDAVPRQMGVGEEDVQAVLVLTKGELGKELGRIDLGNSWE
jgi:hypothetical protein